MFGLRSREPGVTPGLSRNCDRGANPHLWPRPSGAGRPRASGSGSQETCPPEPEVRADVNLSPYSQPPLSARPVSDPMVTLVLGGARSGKSTVAEDLVSRLPAPVTYLATAVADPSDRDFARRIALHRQRRPLGWSTIEAGARLVEVLADTVGTALIDSLGTWVAARWESASSGSASSGSEPDSADSLIPSERLCAILRERQGHTVLVSEEVGMGVHPSSPAGMRFRDVLGSLNQQVAAAADQVLLVVAGRILCLAEPPKR